MKLLCKLISQTGNTGLSSVTSAGLSSSTALTRKQSKMQEEQLCSSNRAEVVLFVDRGSPAEPQEVSLLKVVLKGTGRHLGGRRKGWRCTEAKSHPICIISPLKAQEFISCRIYHEKNEAHAWKL